MLKRIIIFLNILALSLNRISHCLRSYEICTECNAGYYIVRNEWQYTCSSVENCLIPIENNKCSACVNNYWPDANKDCQIKLYDLIDNCRNYNESDGYKCSECEDGFALSNDNSACIQKDNCRKLDSSNNNCILCAKYYILNDDGTCTRSLCEERDDEGLCIKCAEGYFVYDGKCSKNPISYCLNYYFEDHICHECFHFSQLNENSDQCILDKLISGCNSYNSHDDTICNSCSPGYKLSSNKKKCELEYCKTIQEMCYQCKDGYFIADNGKSCQKADPDAPDLPDIIDETEDDSQDTGDKGSFRSYIKISLLGMIISLFFL